MRMRPSLPACRPLRPARHAPRAAAGVVLCLAAAAALAQYKVVAPDGRVTYTDRPPADASARVTPLGQAGGTDAAAPNALPLELQRIVQRYPVTLYASADCTPCDAGRQLLQQRGIPYAERAVGGSSDDVAALERATGARTLPALTIGAQALPGFAPAQWSSYLDAAGYPRESRLPRGWAAPPATPLVERKPAATTAAAPAAASAPAAAAPLLPPASGIRF
jgi:glutaredoxin